MNEATFRSHLRTTLDEYALRWPDEASSLAPIRAQLDLPGDPRGRDTLPGHVTASALVLSGDGRRLLLIRHLGLGLWLQPGGHLEPDESPSAGALREALEETGLRVELIDATPVDVDVHAIPASAKRGTPAHWHFDLRFLTRVASADAAVTLATAEADAFRWLALDDADGAAATDLGRAIDKARAAAGVNRS